MIRSMLMPALGVLAILPVQSRVTAVTLFGIVKDPSGAVVAGAQARLLHRQTGASFQQVSSATGEFTFDFLPVGTYQISIQMQGFTALEISTVELGAAQRVRCTSSMQLGAASETVSVSAETRLVNASSAEQRESISTADPWLARTWPTSSASGPAFGRIRRGNGSSVRLFRAHSF